MADLVDRNLFRVCWGVPSAASALSLSSRDRFCRKAASRDGVRDEVVMSDQFPCRRSATFGRRVGVPKACSRCPADMMDREDQRRGGEKAVNEVELRLSRNCSRCAEVDKFKSMKQ